MRLQAGDRLGHYEVRAPVAAGGMGEVYRGHDARLGRDVAIKVLPEAIADGERLARFERETRVLAALSHPNLLAIFDVGTDQGIAFAVMEFLDGETLELRLKRSALPVGEVLEIGAAVAEGLAIAHDNAVVHRDLKPANIFLTSSGRVKILDFGLARIDSRATQSGEVAYRERAETITAHFEAGLTELGRVMGTVGYMSPEQIRGEIPDGRSDIFSLGCVLYEAATSRRAYSGQTPVEILAAILRDEPAPLLPPWAKRAGSEVETLFELQHLISRCLAKRPEKRFQSAGDLAFTLRTINGRSNAATLHMAGGTFGAMPTPASRASTRPSIAVLPLQNLSPNKQETEYLADGMADALTAELTKLRSVRVISRTSAARYKETRKSLRDIAQELEADALIEGSVFIAAPYIRITAQLVRAETDEYLWAESYQQELRDILLVQADVARAIAREVISRMANEFKSLTENEPARSADQPDVS